MFKQVYFIILLCSLLSAQSEFEKDTITTHSGNLVITFIGHGSLMFTYLDKTIHVDPYSKLADYSSLPDADIILITHHHGDHLDTSAIASIKTKKTTVFLTELGIKMLSGSFPRRDNYTVLRNGDTKNMLGISIEAVPAYNIISKRDNGEPYHQKGTCNGYILTFGNKRIYVAGDTEVIPEMKEFKNIDIAFLPMNLPYTMTPEMVAEAAKAIKPGILYPYHYGETDLNELTELMKDEKGIEVKIRSMK